MSLDESLSARTGASPAAPPRLWTADEEEPVKTTEALRAVLDEISFAASCLNMGWIFEIEELPWAGQAAGDNCLRGWLISTSFRRPDTHTGQINTGRGRQEYVAVGTSPSGVVKTSWLLCKLVVEHELHEAFLWRGRRLFDPHKTLAQLVATGPR